MATDLRELTADIVIAHANMNELSSDDLLKELKAVYATLQGLEKGEIEISISHPKKRGTLRLSNPNLQRVTTSTSPDSANGPC